MKLDEFIAGIGGTTISAIGTSIQTNEVLQTISLIITIIGGIITMVILPVLNWYNKAKQDGKITKDEIKDGIDIATTGVKEVIDDIKKEK